MKQTKFTGTTLQYSSLLEKQRERERERKCTRRILFHLKRISNPFCWNIPFILLIFHVLVIFKCVFNCFNEMIKILLALNLCNFGYSVSFHYVNFACWIMYSIMLYFYLCIACIVCLWSVHNLYFVSIIVVLTRMRYVCNINI
jgi:hypothetical protein